MKFCHPSDPDISFVSHYDINEIKEVWDSFLPNEHHLKSQELLIFQESKLIDLRFSYLIVKRKSSIIGLIYMQLVDFNSRHYASELLDQSLLSLIKDYILKQKTGILICGNLFRIDSECFYFPQKENQQFIFQVLDQFEGSNSTSLNFSGILIKDCVLAFTKQQLEGTRFKPYSKDKLMELAIDPGWFTFDDYLNALSKKYKQRANKILKAGENLTRRTFTIEEFERYGVEIESLYENVVNRQLIKISKLNYSYFQKMMQRAEQDFKITGYFHNDELIAFSSHFYHSKTVMEIHYIGFETEINEEFALYFNILFDGIKEAIEQKIKVLKLGRTGFDAKASAGAEAVEAHHYYRIKRGIPSLAFKYFIKFYTDKEESKLKVRNPFKLRHKDEVIQEV